MPAAGSDHARGRGGARKTRGRRHLAQTADDGAEAVAKFDDCSRAANFADRGMAGNPPLDGEGVGGCVARSDSPRHTDKSIRISEIV